MLPTLEATSGLAGLLFTSGVGMGRLLRLSQVGAIIADTQNLPFFPTRTLLCSVPKKTVLGLEAVRAGT